MWLQLGDHVGAESLLDSALAYWQKQPASAPLSKGAKGGGQGSDASALALGWCLQGLVGLKLKLGKVDEAVKCYQQLQQAGGTASQQTSASAAVSGGSMNL